MSRFENVSYNKPLEFSNHIAIQENFTLTIEAKEQTKILITCPHDGMSWKNLFGLNLAERKNGVKTGDKNVWPIVRDIVLDDQIRISKAISAIRGLMPRRYLDYNRSYPKGINYYPATQVEAQTALDDIKLLASYMTYHDQIAKLLLESVRSHGVQKCLLIDMHGFTNQPDYAPSDGFDIILGSGNRKTIPHGDIDLKLGDYLKKQGYEVFVPAETASAGREEDLYSADFTTRNYSEALGIDALQIEIHQRFRNNTSGKILGPRFSSDLLNFLDYQFS